MVKGKARAAGSFLGGLANNPAIVIIALVLGGLFIFRDRISGAFADLGGSLGDINITLPEIQFPEFPKFPEFPEIKLPDFKLPEIFGGGGLEKPLKMVEDTGLLADPTVCECGSSIVQDAFGNVNQTCKPCAAGVGMNPALALEPSDAELFASQAPAPIIPVETTPIQSILPSGFEAFQVGDSGFVGAAINPTPIQNLSLSQIIDMFDVSASQAANIKAIAKDDFGDFDFGTNTGGGIGSIIPSISSLIGGADLNVSESQFEGLSAQQIANILTGGNISNF